MNYQTRESTIDQTAPKNELSDSRLKAAYQHAREQLLDARTVAGHWEGQLSASAVSTATAISAISFYLQAPQSDPTHFAILNRQIDHGLRWLIQQQNDDGGWGDTPLNYSNISTTMLVVAALHAAEQIEPFAEQLVAAEGYIERQGGIAGLRKRYGTDKTFAVPILANCAMAGYVSWKEVAALPFEAACVPQRFYNLLRLPVVSYAIPALVAIGQVKFALDPPWDPLRRTIRKASINRSLKVLRKMQPASGGYLEAVPLTSFVSMGLIKSGKADHEVVTHGIRFLIDSFRPESDEEGSWPIDTNLATWNTTLSINALGNRESELAAQFDAEPERWQHTIQWLLQCQNRTVHPFTGAAPGGWGWTDLSGAVPDADDTPGALLALRNLADTGDFDDSTSEQINEAATAGVAWLISLQNRDRGWPTFCRGWGRLPFDRSGTDITAHVIRGLLAWRDKIGQRKDGPITVKKIDRAIAHGFQYLARRQLADGSWLPLWFGNQDLDDDINPYYGTAKVLLAYRDAQSLHTTEAKFGLNWIASSQNEDGGWGGGPSLNWSNESLGKSSVEETALCVETLLAAIGSGNNISTKNESINSEAAEIESTIRAAADRGVAWLVRASESNQISTCWPIGFYFAKLWYFEKLYPLVFATAALATAANQTTSKSE